MAGVVSLPFCVVGVPRARVFCGLVSVGVNAAGTVRSEPFDLHALLEFPEFPFLFAPEMIRQGHADAMAAPGEVRRDASWGVRYRGRVEDDMVFQPLLEVRFRRPIERGQKLLGVGVVTRGSSPRTTKTWP